MIRDPSDGSVRETEENSELRAPIAGQKPAIDSGLPVGSTKAKDLIRLEKSREWLKAYHSPQPEGGKG